MVELTIHIEYDLDKRLEKLSQNENTSVADIVKRAIDRYLDEEG